MVPLGAMLLVSLAAAQSALATSAECLSPSPSAATTEFCLGEQMVRRAEALGARSAEQVRELENAAVRYRRAADLGARAEDTLLSTRQRLPADIEVYRRLAQFYARRVTALDTVARQQRPSELPNPGEPDRDGVYEVGANFPAPRRQGMAVYPDQAQAAGIQGGVQAEIVIDPEGIVTDARIVKSIPLLDEAALRAVRDWRFEPTMVDGQPVPVRMVVTVNFTLSK